MNYLGYIWWTFKVAVVVWLHIMSTAHAEGTIKKDACFNEPVKIPCGALREANGVDDVEWMVYDARTQSNQWKRFSYCNSRMECVVMKSLLPNGITVKRILNGTLTLQALTRNSTNGQSRLLCQVHYGQNSVAFDEVKIDFTVCIKAEEASNVNLTKVFQNILPWQHVIDVEIYSTDNSRLAYCNTANCIKITESDLWNRLRVNQGSLLLTEVKESDDRLLITIKVHLRTSAGDTQVNSRREVGEIMETVRVYRLKILVYSSQVLEPKRAPPSTARTDSSRVPPFKHAGSPTRNGTSAAHGKLWIILATTIGIALAVGVVWIVVQDHKTKKKKKRDDCASAAITRCATTARGLNEKPVSV